MRWRDLRALEGLGDGRCRVVRRSRRTRGNQDKLRERTNTTPRRVSQMVTEERGGQAVQNVLCMPTINCFVGVSVRGEERGEADRREG